MLLKMRYAKQLVFLTFLILLTSFLVSRLSAQFHNTLYENGHWVVTKTHLEMEAVGSFAFLGNRNTLAGQHLDLSKWWGFQEVIYKDALDIKEITFDFLLGKDAYIVFIFNKDSDKFSGIRISINSLFDNSYLVSKQSGEFVYRQKLNFINLRPNSWQHFKIVFGRNNFILYVNEALIGTFNATLLQNQLFGFRGGRNKALISNVTIRLNNSKQVIREIFSKENKNVFLLFIIFAALNIGIGLLCWIIFKVTAAQGIIRLINFNLIVMGASLLLVTVDYFYISQQYPRWNSYRHKLLQDLGITDNKKTQRQSRESVMGFIRRRYGMEAGQGRYRILFIGTSQTQGAGASKESKTFVKRIESKLNELNDGRTRFECINAAFPFDPSIYKDLSASMYVDNYLGKLVDLKPRIVVFIFPPKFYGPGLPALNKLIQYNDSHKIKTILLVALIDIEYYFEKMPLLDNWRVTFNKRNMEVMGLVDYYIKNYDRGFWFWDFHHLTDYGQESVAAYLYKTIRNTMKE